MGIPSTPNSTNELLDQVGWKVISAVTDMLMELGSDLKHLDGLEGAELTMPQDESTVLNLNIDETMANCIRNLVEDVHDVIANTKLELMFKNGQINREPGIPVP